MGASIAATISPATARVVHALAAIFPTLLGKGLYHGESGLARRRHWTGSSTNGAGLDQGKAYRHEHPAFDGETVVARRHKAPSGADRLQRGVVERVGAGGVCNIGALDGAVGAHEHPDRHGALQPAPARDSGIGGWRIAGVIGVRERIGGAVAAGG